MKNLHQITPALTETQLGILNYYNDNTHVKKIIFHKDGLVEIINGEVSTTSWARWNNGDWKPYIKSTVKLPVSEIRIGFEVK